MKQPRISRRDFFKLSAFSAGTVAASSLVSIVGSPPRHAVAEADAPKLAIPQPTFNPIASTTIFGPPTDISMGWDGTLWAIDASGAPHIYDAIADAWQPHGNGIEAATAVGNTLYVFSGGQYVTVNLANNTVVSGPTSVAATWPSLPDSFKLSLSGAAAVGGKLVLFNGGWYMPADSSSPRAKLTDLKNWPQTANWADGVIDAVAYAGESAGASVVYLFRKGEYVVANLQGAGITHGPQPARNVLPPSLVTSGTGAASFIPISSYNVYFQGTSIVSVPPGGNAGQTWYIPKLFAQWPATWHPVLQHAPSGRDGNLWCVTADSAQQVLQHDGETWNTVPNGTGTSISVGINGTDEEVFVVGLDRALWQHVAQPNGYPWMRYGIPGGASSLSQVSVGDVNNVWVRDNGNNVHSFNLAGNAFTPAALVGSAIHIAANTDGTLWHCKPSDANAYRFLSESNVQQAGIPVKQGIVTAVQRVAATGFGAAHLLVQQSSGPQVYRYDSPYVFKSQDLQTDVNTVQIVQGLGNLYMTTATSPLQPPTQYAVMALDALTGRTVSATPQSSTFFYSGIVFDPVHELVYVSTSWSADTATNAGQIIALDARDLTRVVWSYTAAAGIDATPILSGTTLVFGDRTGTIYTFDTSAALAAATSTPPQAVTPKWTWKVPTYTANTHRVTTPLLQNGRVYAAVWDLPATPPGGNELFYVAWWAQCNVADGSQPSTAELHRIGQYSDITIDLLITPPVPGQVVNEEPVPGEITPGFFINCGDTVMAVGTEALGTSFVLPAGDQITTGFAYDQENEVLWFGAGSGVLYALSKVLQPVNHTPFGGGPAREINTTPIIYKDAKGQVTILFGLFDRNASFGSLYGFDPDNGNIASVPTGVTLVTAMSAGGVNGMVYTAGSIAPSAPAGSNLVSQAFAIRVDELPQLLRDFVIESQLMQDADQSATNGSTDPNNPIPPSVARYQTHLTVVDDQKAPMPREPVKIWADQPNTVITVDGVQFTIGPGDAQYASVKTGTDGSLVITSDATDVNTSALRAWASFMDPYERIVIYPDYEWHGRASQSYSDPNGDPNAPDPTKPNLSTAYNYKGTQLFTSDEKQQGQPANVANAVGQMRSGVNPGGSNQSALAGALKTFRATDAGSSYVAYADLGGMHYVPNNALAKRMATVSAAVGLRLSKDANGIPGYTSLNHADARNAIDALTGAAWDPNNPDGVASDAKPLVFVVRRSDNIFTDFWNWLVNAFKQLIAKIEQVIVSIADDIMVGIQFIVNGIEKVFKAIVQVIEDVVNAIGSFFLELEKLIEDVIEALSVLFHFGEIIKTHDYIRDQVNALLTQASTALTNTVKPQIDNFFQSGEQAVQNAFNSLIAKVSPNTQGNNLKGAGSTAHTAFSAGPGVYGPSSGSSHAVACSYGTQKLKSNAQSGKETSSASAADDAIVTLWTNFTDQISSNPQLNSALTNLGSSVGNLFNSSSAGDFFKNALVTLLNIIETLIEGVLVITNAFVDLLLGAVADIISTVQSFLNTPIDIPFISWLYQTVFGEPLTFLNVLCLVAAIPITIPYRVIEGHYPSQDIPTASASVSPARAQVNPLAVKILGAFSGVIALLAGIVNGVNDALGEDGSPFLSKISAVLSVGGTTISIPIVGSDSPSDGDWIAWGAEWCGSALGIFGSIEWTGDLGELWTYFSPGLTSGMGLFEIIIFGVTFGFGGQFDPNTDLGFAANLLSAIPDVVNPLKLFGELGALFVAAVDFYGGVAVCVIDFIVAFAGLSARPMRRYFFPFVAVGGGVQGVPAHPLALAGATP